MTAKELVWDYYNSDALRNPKTLEKYIHDGFKLQWYSSKGYLELDKKDIKALAEEMGRSYTSSRLDISHIIAEEDKVSVRYTHYVNAFENPSEEMVLAHFSVIWEIEDNLLFRGYLMSQLDL